MRTIAASVRTRGSAARAAWGLTVVLTGLAALPTCGESLSGSDDDDEPDEDPPPPLLQFEELDIGGAYDSITTFEFFPDGFEFLALGKDGTVWHLELDGDEVIEHGRFELDGTFDESDCGLVSIAFDAEFDADAQEGFFYLGRCVSQTHSTIERFVWSPEGDYDAVVDSRTEILTLGDDDATRPWHNVGSIGFDDDGVMWALFGDKQRRRHGQDPSTNLGALLRFEPNRDPDGSGYTSLADRPFEDSDVHAYGLRSPWSGLLDDRGFWWIGDVGADDWEEIDLVTAPRDNFGWPDAEGPCEEDCGGKIDPLLGWPSRVDAYVAADEDAVPSRGRVAFVGLQYRPEDDDDRYDGALTGRILLGDLCIGFVRVVEVDDEGDVTLDAHAGHLHAALAWKQAPDGYVYALRNGGCGAGSIGDEDAMIFRVLRNPDALDPR